MFSALNSIPHNEITACDISEKMLEKYPKDAKKKVVDLEEEFPFELLNGPHTSKTKTMTKRPMKNCLRVCDFFGQNFNLYIGYKPKFYTHFGGALSLIAFITYILIFIFLGYDDFTRKSPISNTSTVPPSGYKSIKFGEEKIYLPWRIIDYDENPINITGIIYPRIFYFTVHPDNVTGELITLQ